MSYVKATDVLPNDLLNLIQDYIEGEYIYIPRKECNKRAWGELTNSKKATDARNAEIFDRYKAGVTVTVLSEVYYLSPKSIQRIISRMRNV